MLPDEHGSSHVRSRWLTLAIAIAIFLPFKILYAPGAGPYGLDAAYYYEIARNVAEGTGFKSNVSLYYEGIKEFPQYVRVYPLWPLLLGVVASAIGVVTASNVLPPLFFIADLCLLYIFARRIMRNLGADEPLQILIGGLPVDAGHLLVLAFGTNRMFFSSTSHPYTEGLAFAFAFWALISMDRQAEMPQPRAAAITGAITALSFLARSQMICLMAGLLGAFAIMTLQNRAYWRTAAAYIGGFVAGVAPWYVYLGSFFPASALNPLSGLNPFFKYRETPELRPFEPWIKTTSFFDWLTDRAPGMVVAFDPGSTLSYFRSFGPIVALVPVAAAVLAIVIWRRRRANGSVAIAIPPVILGAVVSGVVFHLILMQFHARYFLPWLFGWRHGLGFVFLVVPATIYLLASKLPLLRFAAVAVVVVTIAAGLFGLWNGAQTARIELTPVEAHLAKWIDAQRPVPTLLTTNAHVLGMMTRARYHWIECVEPPDQTRKMLDLLKIDYVIVPAREQRCAYLDGMHDRLRVKMRITDNEDSIFVLERRRR